MNKRKQELIWLTYAADERRNQSDASLSTSDSLSETEEEGKIAVDTVVALKLAGSLDTLPRRCDLDQDSVLLDANRLVKSDEFLRLRTTIRRNTYVYLRDKPWPWWPLCRKKGGHRLLSRRDPE
jgi:hypothetical protein